MRIKQKVKQLSQQENMEKGQPQISLANYLINRHPAHTVSYRIYREGRPLTM